MQHQRTIERIEGATDSMKKQQEKKEKSDFEGNYDIIKNMPERCRVCNHILPNNPFVIDWGEAGNVLRFGMREKFCKKACAITDLKFRENEIKNMKEALEKKMEELHRKCCNA
jgi:hypothetical protein